MKVEQRIEEESFKNPGRKIEVVGIIIMVLGTILSFIFGGFSIEEGETGIGFVVIIAGVIGSYLSGLMTYGLGRLIKNSDKSEKHLEEIKLALKQESDKSEKHLEEIKLALKQEKEEI